MMAQGNRTEYYTWRTMNTLAKKTRLYGDNTSKIDVPEWAEHLLRVTQQKQNSAGLSTLIFPHTHTHALLCRLNVTQPISGVIYVVFAATAAGAAIVALHKPFSASQNQSVFIQTCVLCHVCMSVCQRKLYTLEKKI